MTRRIGEHEPASLIDMQQSCIDAPPRAARAGRQTEPPFARWVKMFS
jgi:hypothetical protein